MDPRATGASLTEIKENGTEIELEKWDTPDWETLRAEWDALTNSDRALHAAALFSLIAIPTLTLMTGIALRNFEKTCFAGEAIILYGIFLTISSAIVYKIIRNEYPKPAFFSRPSHYELTKNKVLQAFNQIDFLLDSEDMEHPFVIGDNLKKISHVIESRRSAVFSSLSGTLFSKCDNFDRNKEAGAISEIILEYAGLGRKRV